MNGFDAQIEESIDQSLTEKQIAFISMSFTAASLLACMLAMYCLFRNHCRCTKIKQNLSFRVKSKTLYTTLWLLYMWIIIIAIITMLERG